MSDEANPHAGAQTDDEIAAEIAAANAGEPISGAPGEPGGDIDALAAENAALNDRVLRLAADLENTRRRAEREKAEAGRYAIANFARDLLSVADNFERALAATPDEPGAFTVETVKGLITGLRMTDAELLSVLQRHGVQKIEPKGEKFDPNRHQAVAQAPSAAPAGHVADVAQAGFMIGERVLRAAMVVVSTGVQSGVQSGTRPGSQSDMQSDAGTDAAYGAPGGGDAGGALNRKV